MTLVLFTLRMLGKQLKQCIETEYRYQGIPNLDRVLMR
jgi:hypothetical protein